MKGWIQGPCSDVITVVVNVGRCWSRNLQKNVLCSSMDSVSIYSVILQYYSRTGGAAGCRKCGSVYVPCASPAVKHPSNVVSLKLLDRHKTSGQPQVANCAVQGRLSILAFSWVMIGDSGVLSSWAYVSCTEMLWYTLNDDQSHGGKRLMLTNHILESLMLTNHFVQREFISLDQSFRA